MTDVLFQVQGLPVSQNRMFATREAALASACGDVELVQDPATGLVFNRAFRSELLEYDSDYQNEQSLSAAFQAHLDRVAGLIDRYLSGQSLIEVGCGKGHFLELLQKRGYSITGLDPTYEGDNPAVVREFFGPETGLMAQGLVLRHVLEHIPIPLDFLRHLLVSNGGKGTIYIEVPCLDWILQNNAWFDIFYEHVNYFRLSDFDRIFGTIHESGHCFGGQYLYVVADLTSLRQPVGGERLAFPERFMQSLTVCAERIRARGGAVWGGASKGLIFGIHMLRAGAPPSAVFDINPAKQGKFLAVTGTQVQPPTAVSELLQAGDDLYVMNPNYLEEIRELTGDRYNYIVT